jgi:hypothetical protein
MDEEIYHLVSIALRTLYRDIRSSKVINIEERSRNLTKEIEELKSRDLGKS